MPRFLLVDDSATVRYMLATALKRAAPAGTPVDIAEANTTESALDSFRAERPDVVFLDMVMDGDVTGPIILDKILALDPTARIVLLTGLPPTDENVIRSVSDGAFAYIQKPVRGEAIRGVLMDLQMESSATRRIQ